MSEAKARLGYAELRRRLPMFAGAHRPAWDQLDAEIREVWIQKAKDVEADPKRWVDSDDPTCVAFALGVLGATATAQTVPPATRSTS